MAQLSEVKKGKNFVVYTDGTNKFIKIEKVRLSFPAIGHMKENEDDETHEKSYSYQATSMLSKGTHVEAKDAFVEIMGELMKANDVAKMEPQYKCIKNGDDMPREEYAGHWIISASDKKIRPTARDEAGKVMLDTSSVKDAKEMESILVQIDEKFYAGAIVDVLLRPWFFAGKAKGKTKTFPKRVCCGVTAIRFAQDDGVRFSKGTIDDSDAWGDVQAGGGDGMDDDNDGL